MTDTIKDITLETLYGEIVQKLRDHYRFATITCLATPDGFELLYHFDKKYDLATLRLRLKAGETLPSISRLVFAAVLVENEMKDLFGIPISDLAVDFQGRFILTENAPKAPLNKYCGMNLDVRVKTPETAPAAPAPSPAPAPEAKPAEGSAP